MDRAKSHRAAGSPSGRHTQRYVGLQIKSQVISRQNTGTAYGVTWTKPEWPVEPPGQRTSTPTRQAMHVRRCSPTATPDTAPNPRMADTHNIWCDMDTWCTTGMNWCRSVREVLAACCVPMGHAYVSIMHGHSCDCQCLCAGALPFRDAAVVKGQPTAAHADSGTAPEYAVNALQGQSRRGW